MTLSDTRTPRPIDPIYPNQNHLPRKRATTIIITTHYIEEARYFYKSIRHYQFLPLHTQFYSNFDMDRLRMPMQKTIFKTDMMIRQSNMTEHLFDNCRQCSVVGMMSGGRLLAEESPNSLMESHGFVSLEQVFLKLCTFEEKLTENLDSRNGKRRDVFWNFIAFLRW